MKRLSAKVARRAWYILGALFAMETVGLFIIAPYWNGGLERPEVNGLACFVGGIGTVFFLLAVTQPGTRLSTTVNRYMFALLGGMSFNIISTYSLWAMGLPVMNGTIKRGLMGENYWLGPAVLAYAVVIWLAYRASLSKEVKVGSTTK